MTYFYKIDFQTNLSHNFTSVCNGNKLKIHIKYDALNDTYFMDVDKYINSKYENIIAGINLVVGTNLFLQFSHYNLGSMWVVPSKKSFYDKELKASTIINNFFLLWEHS